MTRPAIRANTGATIRSITGVVTGSLVLISLWLALTIPASAEIAVADIFAGEGDAQSNSYLNSIFGPLFQVLPGMSGADETLISRLMTDFNIIFFAVGMLLVIYNIVVGVTETAHDGSVLGNRHHAFWGPIRMVVAAAMLIPMGTGYNGIQHAVGYVTKAGTATASLIWNEAVDTIIDDNLPVAAPDYATLDAQFIQSLWRMELCRAAYNQEVAKGGDLEGMGVGWAPLNPKIYSYSLSNRQGACGTIRLPNATKGFERIAADVGSDYGIWISNMHTAVDGMINRIRPVAEAVATAASDRTKMPATRRLPNDLQVWRDAHRAALMPFTSRLDGASKANLKESLTDEDGSALSRDLKANGWTRAGFYYQTIARYSSDATSVQQMLPETTPGDAIGAATNPTGGTFGAVRSQMGVGLLNFWSDENENVKAFLSEIANTYNLSVNWWNESVTRSNVGAFTNERITFADSGGELSNYLPSMQTVSTLFDYISPSGKADPMLGLITLGNGLAALSASVIASLTVLAAVPFVGGAVEFIGTALGWLINGIALAGIFLSFILPMIPTIIWAIAVGAFFLLVVEAVFAAPLWAMAHLTMDAEGFSGRKARRGYILLMSLFLTPVLMLFGLFVGMVMFRILGTLINGGFYYALSSATATAGDGPMTLIWLFGIFVVLTFMALVYLVVIERSFSLISEFPARVFRWFEEIGGSDLDGSTASKAAGTGLVAGGAGTYGIRNAGGDAQKVIGRRNSASRRRAEKEAGQKDGYEHPKIIGQNDGPERK